MLDPAGFLGAGAIVGIGALIVWADKRVARKQREQRNQARLDKRKVGRW